MNCVIFSDDEFEDCLFLRPVLDRNDFLILLDCVLVALYVGGIIKFPDETEVFSKEWRDIVVVVDGINYSVVFVMVVSEFELECCVIECLRRDT